MKERITKILNNEVAFGVMVISGLLILYYFVFARLLLSREYTFGGDTYYYWSFKYFILYSVKYFSSLPWWDPTNFGGFPLYFHFLNGWSNMLGPYYLPSLIIFKTLNYFVDVNINDYIVFHRTLYIISLNMIAIYLISRELVRNRIAAVLPVFIFTFSYFQLLNFHDFYALEAMIAPLFYIFGLIHLNNKRTRGSLILFLISLSFLFASLTNGILMSALYWSIIFTVLLLVFNISLIRDAYRLFLELIKTPGGKIIATLLLLLIISGFIAAWSPFHYNAGHVLTYRGGLGEEQPVVYDTSAEITDVGPLGRISRSEIWTILLSWIPFPEIHDNLLKFIHHGHDNRYIGLLTLPLIFAAFTLSLRNRYVYILFLTYFLCNAFIIYSTGNIVYKILLDNSDIFRNITNMATIFPRGGPPLFLIFLAGIGLDRLLKISTDNETTVQQDIPYEKLFKGTLLFLLIISCVLISACIMSFYSPQFYWMRHSLGHIGIYLLIFTFLCRILFASNNKIVRRALLFTVLLLTFTDLIISASSYINRYDNVAPEEIDIQTIIPYDGLAVRGMTIPDDTVFKPINSESENMFPAKYGGVYHNTWRITWGIKEWLVLATREECQRFLPNWKPRPGDVPNAPQIKSGRMTKYPDFKLFSNGYYLPFEKIKELDTDKSIYDAQPLFYLHDEKLVNSRNTHPLEPISGEYVIKEYTPNKVVIDTKTDKDGFLYFLDNYDRFWSAYIDGNEVKIHRANFTFKAIELPGGIHTVSWVYNPYPIKIAYSIFYLLLLCSALFFGLLYRKKQS